MDKYKCYKCEKLFSDRKTIFSHLKHVHMVREKVSTIECINFFNSYECNKTFTTFNGLRNHLDKCILTGKQADLMVIEIKSPLL